MNVFTTVDNYYGTQIQHITVLIVFPFMLTYQMLCIGGAGLFYIGIAPA